MANFVVKIVFPASRTWLARIYNMVNLNVLYATKSTYLTSRTGSSPIFSQIYASNAKAPAGRFIRLGSCLRMLRRVIAMPDTYAPTTTCKEAKWVDPSTFQPPVAAHNNRGRP